MRQLIDIMSIGVRTRRIKVFGEGLLLATTLAQKSQSRLFALRVRRPDTTKPIRAPILDHVMKQGGHHAHHQDARGEAWDPHEVLPSTRPSESISVKSRSPSALTTRLLDDTRLTEVHYLSQVHVTCNMRVTCDILAHERGSRETPETTSHR